MVKYVYVETRLLCGRLGGMSGAFLMDIKENNFKEDDV